MWTLHQVIDTTKKVLLFGGIGIGGIILLVMLFRFGAFLKNTFFPTPPPAAKVAYGKLPAINFDTTDQKHYNYTLDTVSGDLPALPDRLNVYKISRPIPEFYDLTRATTKATNIGFTANPVELFNNVYQWSEDDELQRKFLMNTVTKNFSLTSAYQTYSPVLAGNNLPDQDGAISTAVNFLKSVNSYPDTINEASTAATLLTIQNGQLIPASSLSTSLIIRVDFYRNTIDKLPIYNPHTPYSNIYVLVAGGTNQPLVVESQFNDQVVSDENSDYPIKTAQQAFNELKAGRGYVASYFGNTIAIKIQNVSLGYYLDQNAQDYLMPIIVFQGDSGFTAYVSAIKGAYIR